MICCDNCADISSENTLLFSASFTTLEPSQDMVVFIEALSLARKTMMQTEAFSEEKANTLNKDRRNIKASLIFEVHIFQLPVLGRGCSLILPSRQNCSAFALPFRYPFFNFLLKNYQRKCANALFASAIL